MVQLANGVVIGIVVVVTLIFTIAAVAIKRGWKKLGWGKQDQVGSLSLTNRERSALLGWRWDDMGPFRKPDKLTPAKLASRRVGFLGKQGSKTRSSEQLTSRQTTSESTFPAAALWTEGELAHMSAPLPALPTNLPVRRPSGNDGNQAPFTAKLATRSTESLQIKKSNTAFHSAVSTGTSVAQDRSRFPERISSLPSFETLTSAAMKRSQPGTGEELGPPPPQRHPVRPVFVVEPIPSIPAKYRSPVSLKAHTPPKITQPVTPPAMAHLHSSSLSSLRPSTPRRHELIPTVKPIEATRAMMKIPLTSGDSASESQYIVKISPSPRLAMASASYLEHGLFNPSPSVVPRQRATSFSSSFIKSAPKIKTETFMESVKRRGGLGKEIDDEEAQRRFKTTISGPTACNPLAEDPNLNVNSYLALHKTFTVLNPQVKHPKIGPKTFGRMAAEEGLKEEYEMRESKSVSTSLRALDEWNAAKAKRKEKKAMAA